MKNEYVTLQGNNISTSQRYNGINYFGAHKSAFSNDQRIIEPVILTKHYLPSVISAFNDKLRLYNGKKRLPRKDVDELHHTLIFDGWVYLNQGYIGGNGFRELSIERMVDYKDDEFVKETEPLKECLWENDVLIDLDPENFNHQGLPKPKAKSKVQEFKKGENVYFFHPVDGAVARFGAISGGAYLYCYRDPRSSNVALGVFVCSEGTQKNLEQLLSIIKKAKLSPDGLREAIQLRDAVNLICKK